MNTGRTQGNVRRWGIAATLFMLHAFAQRLTACRSNDLSRRLRGVFTLGQLDNSIAEPLLEHSLADADDGVRGRSVQRLRAQSLPQATLERTFARAHKPIIHSFDPTALACSNRRNAAGEVDGSPIRLQLSTST